MLLIDIIPSNFIDLMSEIFYILIVNKIVKPQKNVKSVVSLCHLFSLSRHRMFNERGYEIMLHKISCFCRNRAY